jgi:excisionase family DNA binding protein
MQNVVLTTEQELTALFRKEAQRLIDELIEKLELNKETDTIPNVREAAKFTGLAVQTIYQYVNENRMPFFRVGRKLQFSKIELRAWQKAKRPHIFKSVVNEIVQKQSPATYVQAGNEAD